MRRHFSTLLTASCVLGILATPLVRAQDVAFTDVAVFDGERAQPPTTVLVQDGLITDVGSDVAIPQGIEVVDGSGRTLLPGLTDSHVHIFYEAALQQNLVFGVTTVLDMFMDPGLAADMRARQAAGPVPGRADLFSAGVLATAPGGHGTQFGLDIPTLTSPDQAAGWVEDRIAEGSDFIKVVLETGEELGLSFPTLDDATLRAVIEAAHQRGMLVVTHVETLEAARKALDAGTDGLAHIFIDEVANEAFVADAVAAGLFVIPTLTVFQSIGDEGVDDSLSSDPHLLPFLSQSDLQNLAAPYSGFEGLSLDNGLESVRLLHAAGVPILAGTDAMNPGTAYGASLHRELVLLTMAGLTPSEALASATSVPARIFDLGSRGTIAVGSRADLLLVEGDPTADITATRRIAGVWKAGVRFNRDAYRASIEAQANVTGEQIDALAGADRVTISDFESGDLGTAFGQPWEATTDTLAGGNSTADVAVVSGGPNDSSRALQVTGEVGTGFAYPWSGVMFMPASAPFAPADLSDKPTLSFAATGEPAAYRIQMYCQNLGQRIVEWPFSVTDEWQTFEVDLGTVGGCDPTGIMALIFSTGEPGPFRLTLDDVQLR